MVDNVEQKVTQTRSRSQTSRYRRKVAEVDAVQITAENAYEVAVAYKLNFLRTASGTVRLEHKGAPAGVGDWIVREPDGSVQILADAGFRFRYEVPA